MMMYQTEDPWREYIRQCSAFSTERITSAFFRKCHNQIVQWSGVPIEINTNYILLTPNPPEKNVEHPEIKINLRPDLLGNFTYNFNKGEDCIFRGIIRSSSLTEQLELDAVPLTKDYPPQKNLSYARFITLFGKNVLCRPDVYFEKCWKGTQIILVGIFGSPKKITVNSNETNSFEFHIGQNRPFEQCESVSLVVPNENKALLQYISNCKPEREYEVLCTFISRGIPHILQVDAVTNQFPISRMNSSSAYVSDYMSSLSNSSAETAVAATAATLDAVIPKLLTSIQNSLSLEDERISSGNQTSSSSSSSSSAAPSQSPFSSGTASVSGPFSSGLANTPPVMPGASSMYPGNSNSFQDTSYLSSQTVSTFGDPNAGFPSQINPFNSYQSGMSFGQSMSVMNTEMPGMMNSASPGSINGIETNQSESKVRSPNKPHLILPSKRPKKS